MIEVRCWKEEAADTHLKLLVDSLLEVYQNFDKDNDVRKLSKFGCYSMMLPVMWSK